MVNIRSVILEQGLKMCVGKRKDLCKISLDEELRAYLENVKLAYRTEFMGVGWERGRCVKT